MDLQPRFETSTERQFAGIRLQMSFANNKTAQLWQTFMPRRGELHAVGTELYSIEVYPPQFFAPMNPTAVFEKWAAVEVKPTQSLPDGIETITTPAGLYAVFLYRGASSAAAQTYQYILGTWLPASDYSLDDRPHFAVMGEKYKNNDPDSEEELWFPVKLHA